MTKRVFAMLLAVLMLCLCVACSNKSDEGETGDPVINIGPETLTYTDSHGDTFTYDYLTSTTVAITGFVGSDEPHVITIPAVIDGRNVTEIAAEAFYAKSNISEIKSEAALTKIGDYAFAYCEALTTVTLPTSIKTIGKGAFYGSAHLTTVVMPEGLENINDYAFYDCIALTGVTFPASLKTIAAAAFSGCEALTAIVLAEGITTIGTQAFYNCTAVEALTLPASLTEIGDWAFNPIVRDLPDEAITVVEGSYAAEYIVPFR
jgi:hypothetical protein